jgi:hypothetical protein
MLNDFPKECTPERESKIIECVKNARTRINYSFSKLTWEEFGHKGEFLVFEDALKIDNVRINVNAATQQTIADLLRCILPTAKLYDLMWHTCQHKLVPHPRSITSTTQAMIEHSNLIDKDLAAHPYDGIKSTVGKTWIIDNSLAISKPGKACNYGWHFENGKNFKGINGEPCASLLKNPNTNSYWYMIQGRGWCHNILHSDYSQICVLISRQCWIDSEEKDIIDVLKDPIFSRMINHDGVLRVLRQPGVEEVKPIVELPVQKSTPSIPVTISIPPPSCEPTLPSIPDITPKNIEPKINVTEVIPPVKPSGSILALILEWLFKLFR